MRESRVGSASKPVVSRPVKKLRDENSKENNQIKLNIESMSFSYDAGLGANEDASFIDIKECPNSPDSHN